MTQQSAILVMARKEGCALGTVAYDGRQCILPGQRKQYSTNNGGKEIAMMVTGNNDPSMTTMANEQRAPMLTSLIG